MHRHLWLGKLVMPHRSARLDALMLALVLLFAVWLLGRMIAVLHLGAVAAAFHNLLSLFTRPWHPPVDAIAGFAVGMILFAVLVGLGYAILTSTRSGRRMLPLLSERVLLAPLVGAVPVSLIILLWGLAGWLGRAPLIALLAGFGLLSLRGWLRLGPALWARRALLVRFIRGQSPLALALGLLVALWIVPYTLSPAVESDELRYHLSAPAQWLARGRIEYLPWQAFSNFPFLAEMLYLLAMGVSGPPYQWLAEPARLLHLTMLPVNMGLIALLALRLRPRAARRRAPDTSSAWWFLFLPSAPILAAWAFVDLFMSAYFLGFVYLGLVSLRRPRRAVGMLLGLLAAGAVGTKYSMIPLVSVLGLFWGGLLIWRSGRRLAARRLGGAALTGFLFGAPWLIRNLVWTGNPFYPLAWSWFGGGEWSRENMAFYLEKAGAKGMHLWPDRWWGPLADWLLTPWNVTFHIDRYEQHYLGPLPLMALALVLGWGLAAAIPKSPRPRPPGRRPARLWLLAGIVISWAAWFATYQSARMLLPTIGLLFAVAGAAWNGWIGAQPRRSLRMAARALWGVAAVYCVMFLVAVLGQTGRGSAGKLDAIAVGLGFERPEVYLARRLNYASAARRLGQLAAPGDKALLIGEHRTLHFPLPVVASDWFDTPQPLPWLRRLPADDDVFDALWQVGVRFVLLNRAELALYYETDFLPRLKPGEAERLGDPFIPHGRGAGFLHSPRLTPLGERGGVALYRLSPPAS